MPTEAIDMRTEAIDMPTEAIDMPTEAIDMPTEAIDMPTEAIDSRNGPIDSRNGPINSRNGPINSRNGPINSRKGPINSRNGPINSRNGPINSRNGAINSRNGPIDEKSGQTTSETRDRHPARTDRHPARGSSVSSWTNSPATRPAWHVPCLGGRHRSFDHREVEAISGGVRPRSSAVGLSRGTGRTAATAPPGPSSERPPGPLTTTAILVCSNPEDNEMAHAMHFLQRLERISPAEVDLAMSLYRDTPLMQVIIEEAKLPEGAERAAIALRHEPAGPHLVVSRDGGFVTCLGAGMATGELPIISRAKLDSIGGRAAVLRERLQHAERALTGEVSSVRFFRKLATGAHEVSREDISAAMGLAPMLAREYLRCLAERLREWGRARALAEQAGHDRSLAGAPQRYWELNWALGHFSVLTACEPDAIADETDEHFGRVVGALLKGVLNPSVGVSARALWAVGRVGKRALPTLKAAAAGEDPNLTPFEAALGLAVVGLGHGKLEAEARKAMPAGMEATIDLLEDVLAHRDLWRGRALESGRLDAVHFGKRAANGSPWRYEKPEDVPDEVALAFAASSLGTVNDRDGLLLVFALLPHVARARAEDLYLPQAALDALRLGYQPWMTEGLLRSLHAHPRQPVVNAEARPGRNEPCACGSGKKAKKCCGA